MIRDVDWDPDPDRACARDWRPVEAPERRREPKREDESVKWSSAVATDAPAADPEPDLDVDPHRERPGGVVSDGGGRHG